MRFLPRHQRRRVERGFLGDIDVVAVDPQAADLDKGLAAGAERLDGGVDHGGVEVGAGGVAGAGRVRSTVGVAQQLHQCRPVIQVDRHGRGPAGGDDLRLFVVTDGGSDLVTV